MTISNSILIQIAIFILASSGFLVAFHIYRKKRKEQPLVCPIRFDCNTVVHSDYSRFLGIPLEILGMLYYSIIALSGLISVLWLQRLPFYLSGVLLGLTVVAFVFSLYLIGIQLFALKKGCSWCFVSAAISTLIFFLSIHAYNFVN